jgi:hypothetical protein
LLNIIHWMQREGELKLEAGGENYSVYWDFVGAEGVDVRSGAQDIKETEPIGLRGSGTRQESHVPTGILPRH